MSPKTIIALDLGKFKTVGCVMDAGTRQHAFETIEMSPSNVHDLIARHATTDPADTFVVPETCDTRGWVHGRGGTIAGMDENPAGARITGWGLIAALPRGRPRQSE